MAPGPVTRGASWACLAHGRYGRHVTPLMRCRSWVAHDTNLASAALQDSEFVAEVASVKQSLVMLRRNTHNVKLHGDWTHA